MNILPFVFAFIVIFALGTYSLLQDTIACALEEKNYTGFMKAHRYMQSGIERKHYIGKRKNSKPDPNKKVKSQNPEYHNQRENITLHPLSKLNMAPLLAKSPFPGSSLLYETTASLIRILYEKTSAYQSGIEYRILDLLIAEGSKMEELSWERLISQVLSVKDNEPFYKIFRGTKNYELFTNKGYPPLSDFICVEPQRKTKPIHLLYATKPMLLALFGDKLTAQIEEFEKEKWEKDKKHHNITHKELVELFLKNPADRRNLSDFDSIVNYSTTYEKNPHLTVIDPTTGIILKTIVK